MILFRIRLKFVRVPAPVLDPDPTLFLIFEIVKKYLILKANQEKKSINWYHTLPLKVEKKVEKLLITKNKIIYYHNFLILAGSGTNNSGSGSARLAKCHVKYNSKYSQISVPLQGITRK